MPPHHHHHPHHGPHHHHGGPPHHDHGPAWLEWSLARGIARSAAAEHFSNLASALRSGADVQVNETAIFVPELVDFELRYERTPHATFALVARLEWADQTFGNGSVNAPTGRIQIGPASAAH